MKRFFFLCLLCLAVLLQGCEPIENGGEVPPEQESYGELIGTFYEEGRNMTLRLMDITGLYQEVAYLTGAVPVNHTRFDELPTQLKETVKSYGLASSLRAIPSNIRPVRSMISPACSTVPSTM